MATSTTNRVKRLPSQAELHQSLAYDAATGTFVWKSGRRAGMIAGSVNNRGYRYIAMPGYGLLMAHRLAWVYVHGDCLGTLQIDHIDGVRANNAIANLRPVTHSQQSKNRKHQSNNKTGLAGVCFLRKSNRWAARIQVDGRRIQIGCFDTPQEAHKAYCEAARRFFGAFARAA